MSKRLIVIDSRIPDIPNLVQTLNANDDILIVDKNQNGLIQIAERCEQLESVSSIHILSHGAPGRLQLGNIILEADTLHRHEETLRTIGEYMATGGDILLYGCRIAEAPIGFALLHALAHLTSADVAASVDATGGNVAGANWHLEASIGLIDSRALAFPEWNYQLGEGISVIDAGPSHDAALGVAVQPDGKIVAVGYGGGLLIVRLTAAGSLDRTFASDGIATINAAEIGTEVAIQPDGKILVAGNARTPEGNPGVVLARLNSNGSTDASFAFDGMLVTDWGFGGVRNPTFAIQPDGKIVLAAACAGDWLVARFNADGSPDRSFFSPYGALILNLSTATEDPRSVVVQPDGKILVAGTGYADGTAGSGIVGDDFVVARFNANGVLDATFSKDGIARASVSKIWGNTVGDMALQSDGKIVVAGGTNEPGNKLALVRFNPDGSLDTTFSGDGMLSDVSMWRADSLVIEQDGGILVGGASSLGYRVARFNPDGRRESIFDSHGVLKSPSTGGDLLALGLGGQVVVAGRSDGQWDEDLTVLRYNSDGKLDQTFGALPPPALTGTSNNDEIVGTSLGDFFTGLAGDDRFFGLAGDDWFEGGPGDDVAEGGGGRDSASFAGTRSNFTIEMVKSIFVINDKNGNEGTDTLIGIEELVFTDKTFNLINPARQGVPDYGMDNGFLFDAVYYLLSNPELVPTVGLSTALQHYLSIGAAQHKSPNPWFDAGYYANKWPDLAPLHLDDATLFQHYNLYGVWEGRSAGPKFDHFNGDRYLQDWPDVAAYIDNNLGDFLGSRSNGAIAHFIIYGASEQRTAYDLTGAPIDVGYVLY